jgi:hypothetical protein
MGLKKFVQNAILRLFRCHRKQATTPSNNVDATTSVVCRVPESDDEDYEVTSHDSALNATVADASLNDSQFSMDNTA